MTALLLPMLAAITAGPFAAPGHKPRWIEIDRSGSEVVFRDANWRQTVRAGGKSLPSELTRLDLTRASRAEPYSRVFYKTAVDCTAKRLTVVEIATVDRLTGEVATLALEFISAFNASARGGRGKAAVATLNRHCS